MPSFSDFSASKRSQVNGEVPPPVTVTVPVEKQINDNGCWAYVASAISMFYTHNTGPWTPCALMNEVYGNAACFDCCNDVSDPRCDKIMHIEDVFRDITHNLREPPISGHVTAAEIREQLLAQAPVCIRILWPGGDGLAHDVIITGIRTDSEGQWWVDIADPKRNPINNEWPLSELFQDNYGNGGAWQYTYFTQA